MLILLLFDSVENLVTFLQLFAYEIDALVDVLLAVAEALLYEDGAHDFVDLRKAPFEMKLHKIFLIGLPCSYPR